MKTSTFIVLSLSVILLAGYPAQAQAPGLELHPAVKFDVSPPLWTIPPSPPARTGQFQIPLLRPPLEVPAATKDPVVQTSAGPLVNTTAGVNVEGLGAGYPGYSVNVAPPDTNLAVGPNHVFQVVNLSYLILNKTGGVVHGPTTTNTIWSGFGGPCQTTNDGDAIVRYDRAADRWLVAQLGNVNSSPFYLCVAVSTGPDPTGAYNRYAYTFNNLPDYPKFGVWPDAYYSSANMFACSFFGCFFQGAQACAYPRSAMLAGSAATAVCFQLSSSYPSLLPSDLDGATAPPAGEPNVFMNFNDTADTLRTWKFHVDFVTPGNSTFTGPTSTAVAAFSAACSGGGTCIPQAGTGQQLDSLADRLMYRLAYRNFGDHESVVVNHAVTAGSSVGERWYEVRNPAGTPTIFQQGTFAPDSNYRWMGSIAMDKDGNIALGYSVSSGSMNPAIRYTGRNSGDPLGTMQAENTIINGTGSQTGGLDRWGDYSAMVTDPSDDCTFWYTTEYLAANGSFNWHTRIGSFKFTSCGTPPTPPAAPSGLNATSVAFNKVDLAWVDNSNNEEGFKVLRCTGGGCTPVEPAIATTGQNATTYSDTTVAASTTYDYIIRAFNSAGSADSNKIEVTTPAAPTPPAAPTNLAANAQPSGTEIDLTWTDNATNEDSYKVLRCVGSGCTPSTVIATLAANATSYADTSVSPCNTYTYIVRASNAGGTADSSPVAANTPGSAPAAPSGLTITQATKSNIGMVWTDNSTNEANFFVERCTGSSAFCSANPGNFSQIATLGANVTNYTATGLSRRTTFSFRVRASNTCSVSAYSNIASGTTR